LASLSAELSQKSHPIQVKHQVEVFPLMRSYHFPLHGHPLSLTHRPDPPTYQHRAAAHQELRTETAGQLLPLAGQTHPKRFCFRGKLTTCPQM
jgi:hypothetical protein